MTEHGICAKCKKSVGCPYADDRITGCKNFVLEPELKLTNKEWLRNADTEQLAEWIVNAVLFDTKIREVIFEECTCSYEGKVMAWLKQPHSPK